MAKSDKPLLSLGARGTIGDALTYQKRGQEHIVRQKPIPKDPYSLAQAYQRWDYRDYAYLWTLLTNSEKQVYRTKASKYHITGFSQWMREKLKDLPDIIGRWHLDETSGAIAHDSSKNTNNGVIVGASPAPGPIAGAYYFDGVNDHIDCGNPSIFNLTDVLYIEFLITVHTWAYKGLIARRDAGVDNLWYIRLATIPNRFYFAIYTGGALKGLNTTIIRSPETLYHVVCVYDRVSLRIYVNGILDCTPNAQSGALDTGLSQLRLGSFVFPGYYANATIDEVSIRNEVLPLTLIQRHAQRRYPL